MAGSWAEILFVVAGENLRFVLLHDPFHKDVFRELVLLPEEPQAEQEL